jgi:hypothetical protein
MFTSPVSPVVLSDEVRVVRDADTEDCIEGSDGRKETAMQIRQVGTSRTDSVSSVGVAEGGELWG